MNETTRLCERADDLISFIYGELSESDKRSFEQHRNDCSICESELAAFEPIRRSIVDWRDRSLGQVSASVPLMRLEPKRSALAAIRGFFDLSPLWMKGATAFAVLLFCVFAGLAFARLIEKPQPPAAPSDFSTEKFKAAVQKEVALQLAEKQRNANQNMTVQERNPAAPRPRQNTPRLSERQVATTAETPRQVRKPLTRAERAQLAADLRLIQDDDEDTLQLLGDRINR
jgi:hypothetical protein